jgi:hypothetical protein
LTLPINVEYENLEEDIQNGLPKQVDLVSVTFTLAGKTGRKRKIDILQLLDESEVLALEDETETGEANDT